MKIKTIPGASIHAALAEARRLLGDDVVLLESVPANGSEPARITVMVDAPAKQDAPAPASTPAFAPAGYGYGAAARNGKRTVSAEENARPLESFSTAADGIDRAAPASSKPSRRPHRADPPASPRLSFPTGKPGRGRLFPEDGEAVRPASPLPADAATARLEELLDAQLKLLHDRLDAMERRFDSAVVGASHRWVAHSLFGALLNQGFRASTVTSLFDKLVDKGFDPDGDVEQIKWALAHEVRSRMAVSASKQAAVTQIFIGPSGSGKTSLVLKLATHSNFFARRNPTVIVVAPDDPEAVPFQNPVDLYRRFGLPVQSVQTDAEMKQALGRLGAFDHVLIDTPSMPVHQGQARTFLQRIYRMVDDLMPLEVQFVVNATRAMEGLDKDYVKHLPLRPGTIALTHLDEVSGWGRVAEWLIQLQLPVRYVSSGPATPDDLLAFSPTWFVERMMELV